MSIEQLKEIAAQYIQKMDASLQSGQMLLTEEDWQVIDALVELAAYVKGVRGAMEQIRHYQDIAFKHGAMKDAPCFVCGYNGPGYFQPESHPCAERHHKLCKR